MTEQALTDLPVAEGDDLGNMAEAPVVLVPGKIQENECSKESAIEDSGRIIFKGTNMLFLTIDGIRMFTFHEILHHLCPGDKRATVGNRFTRLKATKHACNRAEVKLIKELGGINQTDYYCTLVALADVERYCEKYEGNKPNKETSEQCTLKKGLKEIDILSGQEIKKNKRSFDKARKIKLNDVNSEELSIVNTNQNMPDGSKKRKRRTQFELLQSYKFYTDVSDDENYKRSDGDDQQLTADLFMSDINSNIIDGQNESPTKLNEASFNYDPLDLPYSDENNNSSGSIKPRSPNLLLKRSQNNKWHIAKAALPHLNFADTESEIASDVVIEEDNSKNLEESKTTMTKVKNKFKNPRKALTSTSNKKPLGKKTKMDEGVRPLPLIKKLAKKGEKTVNESNKKQKSSTTTVDEHKTVELDGHATCISNQDNIDAELGNTDNTSVSIQHKNPDRKKGLLRVKDSTPLLKDSTDNLNKPPVVNKEKQDNSASKVVKKKRRRRVEMNTFRLIETIPYPSPLVVKDGDLSPSYTMAYNQKNYLPGCCHALWRWRLGKPVKIPSQSPMKTPDDPSLVENKQLDDPPPAEAKENYEFVHNPEQDEHSHDERRSDETLRVKNGPDEQSHVESSPDENSPDKAEKSEIDNRVQSQQNESSFKEKHDELSSITVIQDSE